MAVLILQRGLHMLYLLKRKEGDLPSKDIVFFNEDQSKEILPSKEKLNLVSDYRQQRKRNKTYADIAVNITGNLELHNYVTKLKASMAQLLTAIKHI